jgi:hypothetical protein
MDTWWQGLSLLSKVFASSALLFSILLVWQLISILIGMDSGSHLHVDGAAMDHGADVHDHASGDGEGVTFSLVSIRSVIAFGTLFSWAGTLYLSGGTSPLLAVVYSLFWGLTAMFAVSYLLYKLLRLQEKGNMSLWTAVGAEGTVYMDIPEKGIGQIRVSVSGVINFSKARSIYGMALPAGTKVVVMGVDEYNVLEVKSLIEEAR